MIALRHGPCRNVHRPLPRQAPVMLNDSPPADLVPFLVTLADVETVEDARDVLSFVPLARRPALVSWMVGRRTFPWEALHAAVASVEPESLRQAVGPERAANLLRLYG